MTRQVFNVAEGKELNQSFGFVANAVTVNNLTQSWAYVREAQTFIPPYQYGVVIPLPGTDIADITWRTPTSLPTGPVGNGTASVTYTDASLPPSNGVSVFTQQTQVVLNAGFAAGTQTFTLPAGCQALLIVPLTVTFVVSCQVKGLTTGAFYFSGATAGAGQGLIIPVAPAADPSVSVQNLSAFTSIAVIALFTSEPEPITNISAIVSFAVANLLTPAGATPGYLPVLQRPTFDVLAVNSTAYVAATGVSLIAAPSAGSSIVIERIKFGLGVAPAAASNIDFGTVSGGLTLGAIVVSIAGGAQSDHELVYDGGRLVGDNLPVFITCSTAATLSVTITYSIVTTANWPTG